MYNQKFGEITVRGHSAIKYIYISTTQTALGVTLVGFYICTGVYIILNLFWGGDEREVMGKRLLQCTEHIIKGLCQRADESKKNVIRKTSVVVAAAAWLVGCW